jgi:hypothetical protein
VLCVGGGFRDGDRRGDLEEVRGRPDLVEVGEGRLSGVVGSFGKLNVTKVSTSRELTTFSSSVCEWSEYTRKYVWGGIAPIPEVPEKDSERRLPLNDAVELARVR